MKGNAAFLRLAPFFLLLAGCSSLMQKSGEALEGKAFAEKTSAVYSSAVTGKEAKIELKEIRTRGGEEALEITSSSWPSLIIRARPEAGSGFHLTQARFLSSHINGWNEFGLDLLGNGSFSAEGGVLYIDRETERIQISSGEIKLKSNRLTGTSALVQLRNRRERILALTEWMKKKQSMADNPVNLTGQREFENYWKPRLFPELVPAKKRPPEYSLAGDGQNTEWRQTDGVKWNKTYTEYFFPEELWQLRNSGAMLRDWEEAMPWIFMEYSWDIIIDSLNEIKLREAKRTFGLF